MSRKDKGVLSDSSDAANESIAQGTRADFYNKAWKGEGVLCSVSPKSICTETIDRNRKVWDRDQHLNGVGLEYWP